MNDRLKKVERVLRVQERLHELAQAELARLDREKSELEDGQETLVKALNKDAVFHGLFVEAMARRLNALAKETDRVMQERDEQSRRLLEEGLRRKRTERMAANLRRQYEQELRKRGFRDLLEVLAGRDDASLP